MDSKELMLYWSVVRKRLWLILLMVGMTLAVVFARSATAKPVYSASVRLHITAPERDEMTIFGQYNPTSLRDAISEAKTNFIDMLKSDTVAWLTIQNLGLQVSPAYLAKNLSVDRPAGTDFVVVSLRGESPELAQSIVNAHVENTVKYIGMLRSRPSATTREFLSTRLASIAREIDAANESLRMFRTKNSIGDLSQEIQLRQGVINTLYLERERASAAGDVRLAAAYDSAIRQREQEVRNFTILSPEHDTLLAKVTQLEVSYKFLLEKEAEAKLKEVQASSVGYIQIVELAQKPQQPASQRTITFAVIGSIISILAGLILIFAWEYVAGLVEHPKQQVSLLEGNRQRASFRPDEG